MEKQCGLLIDKGKYIAGEPIGRVCKNPAMAEMSGGDLVCIECKEILESDPQRITRPAKRSAKEWDAAFDF